MLQKQMTGCIILEIVQRKVRCLNFMLHPILFKINQNFLEQILNNGKAKYMIQ